MTRARAPRWPRSFGPGHAGVVWPQMVDAEALRLDALLNRLEQSEYSTAAQIRDAQFGQLRLLLSHAHATVPFYRERLDATGYVPGAVITPELWARVPLLERAEVQRHNAGLYSNPLPPSHAPLHENQTAGSTGQPVKTLGTAVTRLMWNALTLRNYYWHLDGPQGKLGAIRALTHEAAAAESRRGRSWGRPFNWLHTTGPGASIDCRQDVGVLLDWLDAEKPDHLLIFPSTLEAMARQARARTRKLPRIATIITLSETLRPELRALAREVFDSRVVDMYSAQEVGYIALQCPEAEHYHVQAESLLVEILDDDGKPCAPGQVGRVALTTLHNFASPLLRYVIGDYAEAGATCSCGRGLPVIERILGRTRNLITTPDGRRYWPVLYAQSWAGIAPIHQIQFVQKTPQRFWVRIYAERELLDREKEQLVAAFRNALGYPFDFEFERLSERLVYANGKFDSIMSEVLPPA